MLLFHSIGRPFQWLRERVGRGVARLGITPNALTLLGLPVNVAAGVLFACGHFRWAVAVIVLAGAFDMLDGTVARITGKTSEAGAFLDSSVDRYNDAALFGGVIIWYLRTDQVLMAALGVSALVGSELISYARARAECFIERCKVGFFERGERIVTLMLSAFFNQGRAAMWILGILTHYTVFVRIHYAVARLNEGQAGGRRREAGGTAEEARAPAEVSAVPSAFSLQPSAFRAPASSLSYIRRLIFWDFDRGSLEFDVAAIVFAACAIWLPV
jgi:CDP-diacylglycerol--glycerol-3-phosphate 3-phosphatidyltransferase